MRSITLQFDGEPKAVQSCRFAHVGGFMRKYQPKTTTEWKGYIRLATQSQVPDGWTPIDGPIAIMRALFVFSPPKSLKKADRTAIECGACLPKFTKPDLTDNLFKGLIDAMAGLVFVDDSRICKLDNVSKVYGNKPGITITFQEMI